MTATDRPGLSITKATTCRPFTSETLDRRFPKPCPRVGCLPSLGRAREKARDNARAVAIIWDMHVLINHLIECEIYLSVISLGVGILSFYCATWLHGTK